MPADAVRDAEDAPVQEAPLEAPPPETPPPRDQHWWGETTLGVGEVGRTVAGPFTLWARRREREWLLATTVAADGHAGEGERCHVVPEDDVAEGATRQRFSFSEAPAAIVTKPRPADRAVVVRPENDLAIPSGERVTIYVSMPVWVAVSVGRPSVADRRRRRGRQAARRSEQQEREDVLLAELPTYRLSDTWFGPSTREGELCYASRTAGRLSLEDIPIRPHRAVTPVTVDNRASTTLLLQRLLVPVPSLALYCDADGALWTQGVTLTRDGDGDDATAQVDASPPTVRRGAAERVSDPRVVAPTGVVRAFSRLFLRPGGGAA